VCHESELGRSSHEPQVAAALYAEVSSGKEECLHSFCFHKK